MAILFFILARLKEPSTYAGLAALLALAGLSWSEAQINAIIAVLVAISGALAVFLPDPTKPSA